jgi:hypothetical protein
VRFSGPEGVAVLANSDVLVSDQYNQAIRKIVQGAVSTLAGARSTDKAPRTRFHYPRGIALAPDGALFIADYGSHAVRRMDANAAVTTVAGQQQPGLRQWRRRRPGAGCDHGRGFGDHLRAPAETSVLSLRGRARGSALTRVTRRKQAVPRRR